MKNCNVKEFFIWPGMAFLIFLVSCKKQKETIETPSEFSATAVSTSRIELRWTDISPDETGYIIERKTSGGAFAIVSALSQNINSYSDTGLSPNTSYIYRIYLTKPSGNGPFSNEVSATTFLVIEKEWQRSLGGLGNDYGFCIRQTTDSGYIVAGSTESNGVDISGYHGGGDFWVTKLGSNGSIQWQKCLGGTGNDFARSIQQTPDGGYVVAGTTHSNDGDVTGNKGFFDFWIVKLTSAGDLQWQKTLGGTDRDYAYSIQQASDGGYIVAGNTRSSDGDVTGFKGADDFWVVKLTSSGNIQWQKTLGGSLTEIPYSVEETSDGGFIVAGYTESSDGDITNYQGNWDIWIVKLTNTGSIQWQKTYGGSRGDVALQIRPTSDGGYIVAGHSSSTNWDVSGNNGFTDFWILKISNTGAIQWQRSLGGSGDDAGFGVEQTSDGGYIVCGIAESNDGFVTGNKGGSDFWIVKLTSSGAFQGQKTFGGSASDFGYSIRQTNDGGFIVAGFTASNNGDVSGNKGGFDYWIVKVLK